MKKFGEYITESQDHTITEERLHLIDEAIRGRGFGAAGRGPRPSGGRRVRPIGGRRVKPKAGNRPVAPEPKATLGSRVKQGLKTYVGDVGREMRSTIGMGLGFNIANRLGRIGRREYDQSQYQQQSQMPGNEKLQPRSSRG